MQYKIVGAPQPQPTQPPLGVTVLTALWTNRFAHWRSFPAMRCTAAVQMGSRTGHSFLPIRFVHALPRLVAVPCSAQQSASAAPAQDALDAHLREQERLATGFTAQYQAAYTMAQLYANERPAPIDHSEHVARRKRRDAQELVEVGVAGGMNGDTVAGPTQQHGWMDGACYSVRGARNCTRDPQ